MPCNSLGAVVVYALRDGVIVEFILDDMSQLHPHILEDRVNPVNLLPDFNNALSRLSLQIFLSHFLALYLLNANRHLAFLFCIRKDCPEISNSLYYRLLYSRHSYDNPLAIPAHSYLRLDSPLIQIFLFHSEMMTELLKYFVIG